MCLIVSGVPNSHVFGSLHDGVFDGKIITPQGTYYVERASKYSSLPSTNQSLHSVIYSEHDVHDPYHRNRTGECNLSFIFVFLAQIYL